MLRRNRRNMRGLDRRNGRRRALWAVAGRPCYVVSREDVFDDVAVDVGEAEVSAGVAVGELFVVEAEEVKHGGVEVVDVDFVFGGFEAEFVGRTVGGAAADAATC